MQELENLDNVVTLTSKSLMVWDVLKGKLVATSKAYMTRRLCCSFPPSYRLPTNRP